MRRLSFLVRSVAVTLLSTFVPASAAAQSLGAVLSGIVSDETGARLPNATLTVTNVSNGRTYTAISDVEGAYRIVALQPARYRVDVSLDGFERFEQDITLTVGSESILNVPLLVARVTQVVTVAPSQPLVDVAQSQPSSIVTDDQIRALPELGRNFLVLAQLVPGSGPLNASVGRFMTTKFGGPADQRSGFTTLIDGGDVDDAQWGSPTINVTQEGIQEFKVFRYQFDAQYGNALNAVVSVITKSGANQFDGSAFYFGRDDALNARNAFAREKPNFRERRLGASLGGPIVRNQSHLFGAYESDDVETARIIALPATSRFAASENGVFPASSDDRMAVVRLDHRFSPDHSLFIRYGSAWQSVIRSAPFPTSDTAQTDTFNRAYSVVAEDDRSLSSRTLNALRVHWFRQASGGVAHRADRGVAEAWGGFNHGIVNGGDLLDFPRTEVAIADAIYTSTARHDIKVGGEFTFGTNELRSQFFMDGLFRFSSETPFNPAVQSTWPLSYLQQTPSVHTYKSRQIALFVQDDWRVADRVRLNLGLRYDLDPTLRINDFYHQALNDPALAGLSAFVSSDRGTDTNNLQPRVGATFDLRGDGALVLRGGWGMYVARNRPWFQVRSMNQLGSSALLVENRAQLRFYPDVAAVLAGGAAKQLGTVIPDDFVQSYALNTTVGVGWQFGSASSLDVDYVHSYGAKQYGTTDRNLPPSGPIGPDNPRPVPQFGQVGMLENYTKSWYDALESQFRTRLADSGSLQLSYTLSRTYLDGVDFFLNQRGTQRTPQERGYSPSDQWHNFTLAASYALPADVNVSGILKLISGSPILVQAGGDLDGDGSTMGDRPPGLPITVGRGDVAEQLRLINQFRATINRPPVDPQLLELDEYHTLDVRVAKTLSLGGRRRLELLLEAFNVTNHVNYASANVNRSMNSPSFLTRTAARDARQVQWGVRFSF